MLMDEIFGEKNFIGTFLWKKKGTSTNTEGATVSPVADYQVCYQKSTGGINYTKNNSERNQEISESR